MHASVMEWLRQVRPELGDIKEWFVLEVGSYNENGTARDIYGPQNVYSYVGIDQREGPGVDKVMDADRLLYHDGAFDLVICTEMLEHDPRPWKTLPEMARVLRRGGHLLLTARGFDAYGGYPEHPCPEDYWRFNPSSMAVLLQYAQLAAVEITRDARVEPGVLVHAIKP